MAGLSFVYHKLPCRRRVPLVPPFGLARSPAKSPANVVEPLHYVEIGLLKTEDEVIDPRSTQLYIRAGTAPPDRETHHRRNASRVVAGHGIVLPPAGRPASGTRHQDGARGCHPPLANAIAGGLRSQPGVGKPATTRPATAFPAAPAAPGVPRRPVGPVAVKHVLFVCSQNRLRSPTAERVFSSWEGIAVASAGLNHDADTPLTPEWLQWADLIFVMEPTHRKKLAKRFRAHLHGQRVVCLHISDEYDFMDPALVALLRARVPPYLDRP